MKIIQHILPSVFALAISTLAASAQQGGGGGGQSVTIRGTLPAFAATPAFTISGTPTVNLGTLGGAATAAGITTINTTLGTPMQNSGGSVTISGTLPAFASTPAFTISGTLPAFAATPTVNLGTIAGVATAAKQPALGTAGTPSADALTVQGISGMTALKVDGSAVTQPVSAATLPLPTGSSTAVNQTNASQKTQIVDGAGSVIASTSNNLNVQCANCSGSGVSTGDTASFTPGTSLFAGGGGFFQTTPTSNPLTTGQQGAFQVTANRALFTNPRNAAGAEIATAANPFRTDPTGTTTQPVSGTVTSNAGTNLNTSLLALESGGNLATLAGHITATVAQDNVKQINGVIPLMGNGVTGTGSQRVTVASDNTPFSVNAASTQSGTWTVQPGNTANTTAWKVDGSAVTQPVSAASLPLPAGASTAAKQAALGIAGTPSADVLSVQGAASMTALKTDGSAVTQPVSAASLPLPAGAATAALQPTAAAQGSATSGQTGHLTQGAVTTASPTYTTGQTSPFSLDTSGNLRVNVIAGGGTGGTSSSFSAAFPATGTAIGAKNGANMVNLVADGSGNLDVNCIVGCAGGTTSNASSAVATSATNGATVAWLYLFNGTTWDQAQADASKNLKVVVNAALPAGGNALGSVIANAGTNLNTSALALDTSVNGINNAQGAVTAGKVGPLVQGAVTTAAPTYTTAQMNPLSLTTSGALRTDASGSTQPVSGTVSANSSQTGTWTVQPGNTANTTAWKVDGSAVTQPVSAAALPLPTGASSSANQTNASQKTQIVDGSGSVIASTSNNLNVQCANCSGSGVSTGDAASFTAGSSLFAGSGGFFQTTPTNNALTTGQQGAFQVTANRALFTNPRNAAGTEIATAANPFRVDPTGSTIQPVSGTVSSNATQTGTWTVQPGNTANTTAWKVDGSAVTQPVSAATLPLPTGAATSALQPTAAAQGSTTSGQTGHLIEGAVTTASPTYTTAQTSPLSLTTAGAVRTDASATTQPVSGAVTSNAGTNLNTSLLALESGGNLATLAGAITASVAQGNVKQINGVTPLMGNGVTGTGSQRVTVASDNTPFSVNAAAAQSGTWTVQPGNTANTTAWKVDNSAVTQPVSAASLPLPTGAATSAIQTNASQKTQIVDGAGSVIASTSNNLNVQCANCSGSGVSTADAASFTSGTSLFAGGGGFFQTTPTNNALTTGQQGMFQTTANRALFVNQRNAAGTETATASNPLRVDPTGTTIQPVNGTVTSNAGTNLNTSLLALESGGNLATLAGSITSAVQQNNEKQINGVAPLMGNGVTGTGSQRVTIASDNTAFAVNAAATQTGTWTVQPGNTANTTAWKVDASATTQPVSAASLPLPAGASTAALQPTAAAQGSTTSGQTGHLIEGAVTTAAPTYTTAQTNPLSLDTSGSLRVNVTAGGVSGNVAQSSTTSGQTGTMAQGAVTTAAPTYTTAQTNPLSLTTAGALRTDTSTVNGVAPLTGNGVAGTGAQRVTIASDNTAFSVNAAAAQSGTWTVQPGNTANTTAWKVDNSGVTQPVSAASLPLPTGASTAALQPTAAAQGSTTSGQTGHLMEAAVTTAAPTYTTAQTSPLSMTTAGGLRVDASATAIQGGTVGSTPPAGANTVITGGKDLAGNVIQPVLNPCQTQVPAYNKASISTATNTLLVAGASSKKTYICAIFILAATATPVAVVEGSGTSCQTSTLGVIGGASTAAGLSLDKGFTFGNGMAAIAATTVNNNDLCLITSAAVQTAVTLATVQQ